jgi:predicted nucleotidyltransferase
MTWRVPPYDRALDAVVAHVRATYAPIGVLVAGSIVRGEGGPTSDLDVCVVHEAAWRVRDQRRFAGVPVEIFVNPAAQVRRYFASEHADGRPCTAHMWSTGEVIEASSAVIAELVAEAQAWMARPLEVTDAQLVQRRYMVVDSLDDARDVVDRDPGAAMLLLGEAIRGIVAYAFWQRRAFQPRRKDAIAALEGLDAHAANLARVAATSYGRVAVEATAALARHVLGVDTFFAWTSAPDPVSLAEQ